MVHGISFVTYFRFLDLEGCGGDFFWWRRFMIIPAIINSISEPFSPSCPALIIHNSRKLGNSNHG